MTRKGTHIAPVEDAPPTRLSDRARELLALALCGFSLYALLGLATFRMADVEGHVPTGGSNLGGSFGYTIASAFTFVLGLAAWVPFLALLGYAVALFLHRRVERLLIKVVGTLVFAAMVSLLLAQFGDAGHTSMTPEGAGGKFGANLSPKLQDVFGGPGRLLLVGFGALVSFLLVTEFLFSSVLVALGRACERLLRRVLRLPEVAPVGTTALEVAGLLAAAAAGAGADDGDGDPAADEPGSARARRPRRAATGEAAVDATAGSESDAAREAFAEGGGKQRRAAAARKSAGDAATGPAAAPEPATGRADEAKATGPERDVVLPQPKILLPAQKPKPAARPKPRPRRPAQSELPFDEAYPYPPLELFREVQQNDVGATQDQLQKGGESIVQKLGSFGIQSEVVAASIGPAVTQFELRLAEGIRVNKIAGFEADLAAALRAVAVRVVAPIPGKDTIGVEVPNVERQKVFMRDLLDQFGRAEDLAIPLYLGKDVAGNPIVEDLARMPHLLIAGTTGSGKSVCINAILLSILMTRTPAQVKLILVDPKMVELQAFKSVPHLCCEVVTNMKKAPAVLQWAVDEMENRYALLSAAGVNHIRSYNRLGQQELERRLKREIEPERVRLPYIVTVIDEFADLMNVAQNEVEESIQRLAQKSRSVGMHVILATQRPSSEVITGIIKANLPCQIAFKVNRRIDSRVILDANGAEKLLGYGDMLYVPPGGGTMLRAQGTFVADEETQAVVRFLAEQGQQPSFLPELVQSQSSSRPGHAERDALYREAVEVILGQQRGSATLLQRALSVGYTRATRLLEMMEEDGLVGPFVGSKSRDVLLTLDEWKVQQSAMAVELEAAEAGAGAADAGAAAADAATAGDVAGDRAGDGDAADGDAADGDRAPAGEVDGDEQRSDEPATT